MVMVWNFQLYMLPLTLIVIFMWCLIVIEIKGGSDNKEKMAFVSTTCCHNDGLILCRRKEILYIWNLFSRFAQ